MGQTSSGGGLTLGLTSVGGGLTLGQTPLTGLGLKTPAGPGLGQPTQSVAGLKELGALPSYPGSTCAAPVLNLGGVGPTTSTAVNTSATQPTVVGAGLTLGGGASLAGTVSTGLTQSQNTIVTVATSLASIPSLGGGLKLGGLATQTSGVCVRVPALVTTSVAPGECGVGREGRGGEERRGEGRHR